MTALDYDIFLYLLTVSVRRQFDLTEPKQTPAMGGDLVMLACEDVDFMFLALILETGGKIQPCHWNKCIEKDQAQHLLRIIHSGCEYSNSEWRIVQFAQC